MCIYIYIDMYIYIYMYLYIYIYIYIPHRSVPSVATEVGLADNTNNSIHSNNYTNIVIFI